VGLVTLVPRTCAVRQELEAWGGQQPALPLLVEKPGRTKDEVPRRWHGHSVLRQVEVEYSDGRVAQECLRFIRVNWRSSKPNPMRLRQRRKRRLSLSTCSTCKRWAISWQPVSRSFERKPLQIPRQTRTQEARSKRMPVGARTNRSGTMRFYNAPGIRQSRRAFSGSSCISEAPRGEHFSP
jgi:hypothetical protein